MLPNTSKHCLHPNTQHPLVTRRSPALASSCRIARGCVARRRSCYTYRCARRHFLAFLTLAAFFFAFFAEPELDPELDPESESEPESEPEPDEDPEEEDPWLG